MNLQSKKARVPIAALGVTALCIGGMGAFASSAFAAPTSIGLNSGATTPVVANLGTASGPTANTAYAIKSQDATDANMAISLESSPTGGNLAYEQKTSNGAATAGFSNLTAAANNEVQAVTITGTPTGGTFTLTYAGQTTGAIVYNATASAVQTALVALSNVGAGNISVGGGPGPGTPYTVTFTGTLGNSNVAQMTATSGALTGGVAPAVTVTTTTPGTSAGTTAAALGTVLNTDYVYITGDVPGTYKVRLFQDTNGNLVYDAADERSSDLITLTVYDAVANTTSTSDDVSPVIAATSPITQGLTSTATITYDKALSMSDARGTSASGIAAALAAQTFTDSTAGGTGITPATGVAATYTASTQAMTFPVGTPTTTGTIALRTDFSSAGSPTTNVGLKNIVVQSNGVTGITLADTDVSGSVKGTTAGGITTVAAKKTATAIKYTATVANTTLATDIVGKTVYFTLSGTDVASLTTDGTTVDSSNHIYSAVTDSNGVATLTVTDGAATVASYGVLAMSNNIKSDSNTTTPGVFDPLAVTYGATDIGALTITTSASDLTQLTTATSVTVKGKLTDQFGSAFSPGSSDPVQVTVSGAATGFAPVASDGTFSYTYTPTSTPSVGSSAALTFSYTSGAGTTKTATATIQWTSATAPATITIVTPAANATKVIETHAAPGGHGTAVTGTVFDASSNPLAFKAVTLSGDGVYFSTTATPVTTSTLDDLTKTLTVVTDSTGSFTGYAFYTKPGNIVVTATSATVATATATVTVVPAPSIDPYTIAVDDVVGNPGATVIVTGKVTDMFGNGVPNVYVDLNTGTSTVGTLASTKPMTNSAGVFSTSFTAGSNQSGVVTLTGTLYNYNVIPANATIMTTGATLIPDPTWLTAAGLTFDKGVYQSTGKITVAAVDLTLTATTKITGSGSTTISGMFMPKSTVDIYAKASGADSYSLFDSLTTDADGKYSSTYSLKKSTNFLAKSGGLSSPVDSTTVYSAVTLTAKSSSKGHATLSANGAPSAKGTLTFYRSIAGKDPILKTMSSNTSGNGSVTVSLPKGTRSVYVVFKAPGTGAGTSKTVKVKVK